MKQKIMLSLPVTSFNKENSQLTKWFTLYLRHFSISSSPKLANALVGHILTKCLHIHFVIFLWSSSIPYARAIGKHSITPAIHPVQGCGKCQRKNHSLYFCEYSNPWDAYYCTCIGVARRKQEKTNPMKVVTKLWPYRLANVLTQTLQTKKVC